VENGNAQTFSTIVWFGVDTNDDRVILGRDVIQFRSDANETAVPEPSTLTLLGFAVAGLAGAARLRQK
jgi:hypothetical protein